MTAAQPEFPQSSLRHALTMVILCVAGGTIFNVVYVFEVYYLPLQQAMGLSKSQIGMLLGVFGAFSMLSYGPGDRDCQLVGHHCSVRRGSLVCSAGRRPCEQSGL